MIPARSRPRPEPWLGLAIALATAAVFYPLVRYPFIVYDDLQFLLHNPHVRTGLTAVNLRWAFTNGYAGMWCPLTWISHMLVVEIFGLAPGSHHATNVVLHVVATLLLFSTVRSMTGRVERSAVVAGLFALHPLHVQSVAWVAERKDVLSAVLAFATIRLYVAYARRPSFARYGAVALALTLGLMAKPMLVTLPFVLLLLDYWPLGRLGATRARSLVLEKLPLLVPVLATVAITMRVQHEEAALTSLELLPLSARLANAVVSYARYLGKTFWPADLAIFYPYPAAWSIGIVAGSAALLVAITSVAVALRRSRPYLIVGWLFFAGMLVPVIGLLQTGSQAMADRYTYVPHVGLFLALVFWLGDVARERRVPSAAVRATAIVVLAALALVSRSEVVRWSDSVTLFRRALDTTPDNPEVRFLLAASLLEAGRSEEAAAQLAAGLRLDPRDARLHNSLGAIHQNAGRTEDAIREFESAIEVDPGHPIAHMNLGVLLFQAGRREEGLAELREAARLDPSSAECAYRLGFALGQLERPAEAESPLRHAVEMQPDWAEAWNELGVSLARQGRLEAAVPCFVEALRLEPGFASAARNLERARAGSPKKD